MSTAQLGILNRTTLTTRTPCVLYASGLHPLSEDHLDPELSHAKTSLPFQDQVVSFTGITWEKPALSEKLRAMGVKHIHMDLTLDATALISRGHESLKYEVSISIQISISTSIPNPIPGFFDLP